MLLFVKKISHKTHFRNKIIDCITIQFNKRANFTYYTKKKFILSSLEATFIVFILYIYIHITYIHIYCIDIKYSNTTNI